MAKIPTILEAGRADGKLVTSDAIFDENKGMFQSEINDIQDTLNSDNPNKPLSAKQGKTLKELLDTKVIETGNVPIDAEPTEGNTTNVVNSDGIYKALSKKVNNITFEERNKNQDEKLAELEDKLQGNVEKSKNLMPFEFSVSNLATATRDGNKIIVTSTSTKDTDTYLSVTYPINVADLNKVTISNKGYSGTGSGGIRIAKSNDGETNNGWIDSVDYKSSKTFDVSSINYILVYLYAVQALRPGVGHYMEYDSVQVEEGDVATEYVNTQYILIDKKSRKELDFINSELEDLSFELGSIDSSGYNVESNNRIRSVGYIRLNSGDMIRRKYGGFAVVLYNDNKEFSSNTGWRKEDYTADKETFVRIIIRYSDTSTETLNSDAIAELSNAVYIKRGKSKIDDSELLESVLLNAERQQSEQYKASIIPLKWLQGSINSPLLTEKTRIKSNDIRILINGVLRVECKTGYNFNIRIYDDNLSDSYTDAGWKAGIRYIPEATGKYIRIYMSKGVDGTDIISASDGCNLIAYDVHDNERDFMSYKIQPSTINASLLQIDNEFSSTLGNVIYHADKIIATTGGENSSYRAIKFNLYKFIIGKRIRVNIERRIDGKNNVSRIRFINSKNDTINQTLDGSAFIVIPNGTYRIEINCNLCWGTSITENSNVIFNNVTIEYENSEFVAPSYFFNNNYLQNKIDRINYLLKKSASYGGAFVFITDMHWYTDEPNVCNQKNSPALLNYLKENTHVNTLITGGDLGDGCRNECYECVDILKKAWGNGEFYKTTGNHEYINSKVATEANVYYLNNMYNMHQIGNPSRQYYYVDNPQLKIRYVIINAFAESSDGGVHANNGYEPEQIEWLTNEAFDVKSGWGILIFTHFLYLLSYSQTATGANYLDNVILPDVNAPVVNAIKGYQGNGTILGVVQGHIHRDRVIEIDNTNVPTFLVTSDKNLNVYGEELQEKYQQRLSGTRREQAFDVFILDRNNGELRAVRVGCPAFDGFGDNKGTNEADERVYVYNPIAVNETKTLDSGNLTNVSWQSNDNSVATVVNGVVTGQSDGRVTISCIGEQDSITYTYSYYIKVVK